MSEILVEYDHRRLVDRYPENVRAVSAVPREGESVTVFGDSYIVHHVHWWEMPAEPGKASVRIVLRTPEEHSRVMRGPHVDSAPG